MDPVVHILDLVADVAPVPVAGGTLALGFPVLERVHGDAQPLTSRATAAGRFDAASQTGADS